MTINIDIDDAVKEAKRDSLLHFDDIFSRDGKGRGQEAVVLFMSQSGLKGSIESSSRHFSDLKGPPWRLL